MFVLEYRGMATTEPTAGERDNYRTLTLALREHRITSGTPDYQNTPPIGATAVAKLAAEARAALPAVDDEGRALALLSLDDRRKQTQDAFRKWLERRAKADDPRVKRFIHSRDPLQFYDPKAGPTSVDITAAFTGSSSPGPFAALYDQARDTKDVPANPDNPYS